MRRWLCGLVSVGWWWPALAQSPAAVPGPLRPVRDLAFYQQAARQSSPLLLDNLNQIRANTLEAERLRAFYTKPLVSLTANAVLAPVVSTDDGGIRPELNSAGATTYLGYDLAVSNGGLYQGLLNVSQPISNLFRYRAYAEPTVLASQISRAVSQLTAHDVEKVVADQYVLCWQDNLQMKYTDSLLSLLTDQRVVVQKLVEASLLKLSELTLVDIEQQTQRSLRIAYATAYRRDVLELNALSGLADTTLVDLAPLPDTLGLPVDLSRSGFTRRYALDSLALSAQQAIVNLRYRPQWTAFANAGLNTSYLPDLPRRLGFSAGVSLTWFLYDGHQQKISQQRTAVLQQSLGNYRTFTQRQNAVRRERVLGELRGLDARAQVIRQQLAGYESVLSSYRRELMQGQLPVVNYILVLKNMVAARRDALLLQTNRALLRNAYTYWNW